MSVRIPRYINRELSWLAFNQRVLDEASDPSVPLLERLNFLSITASNLDEFFMVRIGELEFLHRQGSRKLDATGLSPTGQLRLVRERVRDMVNEQYRCFRVALAPSLADAGLERLEPESLDARAAGAVNAYFNRAVFPVITPMEVSGPADFPLLTGLGLTLAVRLAPAPPHATERFALLPLGARVERFVDVPESRVCGYVLIEDLIRQHVSAFFPGQTVAECVLFRLTRSADQRVREDMGGDLLSEMEVVLSSRRKSHCVRLEVESRVSPRLFRFLRDAMGLHDDQTYRVDGPLDLSAFRRLVGTPGFQDLRYAEWPPQPSPDVDPRNDIFTEITRHNILLSHPYESFDPVVRLVSEAADDPDVLAIKQILYRTSPDSPIVAALGRAARAGKYVTAIVELKARFDEARNIKWARALEEDGVQVIYGIKGLKTHAKLCIVVRREGANVVRYCHFGTGNYNERTARLYTDVGFLTRDPDLGNDASRFFNAITGRSEPQSLVKLAAAPLTLKAQLIDLIRGEAQRRRDGQETLIMARMNALVDDEIIAALYEASAEGVPIQLNVRGTCCLRPGVNPYSKTISVVSIVDRFLEHSRVFYFFHGGEERVFISSADWMPRNLDRRIELLIPVEDAPCRQRLVELLRLGFADNVKARRLQPDGRYRRLRPKTGEPAVRSQEAQYLQACERSLLARRRRRTVFEPHRRNPDAAS